ncbi:MAG: Sodium-dependent dicarboxylate transporter SdcS [Verrucomicrobia subdivision 3 bacterium]|nr:Sodium-dependent dicarboxylate transporter SdcS [Limisphaerales bacterium]MCS1416636.1 Sodium-dependent dicarboxylate transporter SdcS [Limisphaerales bacterium]
MSAEAQRAGAVAALMAVWWIFEAIPLSATALIPLALFPVLGVISAKSVSAAYGNPNIFLFAGGFFIAVAMQKWNLHERIALNVVQRTGSRPQTLVWGFMLATAFLSMWISNTATALMMLPIALAVVETVSKNAEGQGADRFAVCVLLGIAYAASIGGVSTLIGTPPNGVFLTQFAGLYPKAGEIGFFQWMLVGLPLSGLLLPLTWLLLTKCLFRFERLSMRNVGKVIDDRLLALGPMNRGEKIILTVWGTTALAWIFRSDIDLGGVVVPGWSRWFPEPTYIHNGTIAIFSSLILFVIPVDRQRGEFALDWNWAKRIPWGILILFGGGLALAEGFSQTKLVQWLGGQLTALEGVPPILVIATIALILTFVTELTSNVATVAIMVPILGGALAPALGIDPLLLMIPATISASCAFMLPVATPPNAIVFGGGRITVPQMARAGLAINFLGVLLVTFVTYSLAVPVFDISLTELPDWVPVVPAE